MGQDKSQIRWPPHDPNAPALLELVVSRVRQVFDDVVLAGYRGEPPAGTRVVPDEYPDGGSLGGLYSGLISARHPRALAVATDMPFLNVALLRWLAKQQGDWDALVPLAGEPPRPEPLHAVYRRSAAESMHRLIERGERRLMAMLDTLRTEYVPPEMWAPLDPDGLSFVNLNTPDDVQRAEEHP